MKRPFLLTLLAILLLCSSVSCRNQSGNGIQDTTAPATASMLPTDGAPAEPTETKAPDTVPPVEDMPTPTLLASSYEGFYVNGTPYFLDMTGVDSQLAAQNNTVTLAQSAERISLSLEGWVSFERSIDSFGYRIDSHEPVFGNFALDTEDAVKAAGGTYALRFCITLPLFELTAGTHTVAFIARLADGTVAVLHHELTVVIEGLVIDTTIPFHSSVTHINGGNAYAGRGGNTERGVDIIDGAADGKTVNADCTISVNGWVAVSGGVERYVWSANGGDWYDAASSGKNGEPSAGHFASLGFTNASGNAILTNLKFNLAPYDDMTVDVTLGAVPREHPDKVVPFVTITGLYVPDLPEDLDFSFVSNAGAHAAGTDFMSTDLQDVFFIGYGAGEPHAVEYAGDTPYYSFGGINQLYTLPTGSSALRVNTLKMNGTAFLFMRGTRTVRSVVQVPLPLDNFFETDGSDACGGAGIYARLSGTTLTVIVKVLDPQADYRISNRSYRYNVQGTELTMADDRDTIYILVDGQVITKIILSGEQSYPEHFSDIQPQIKFAETAMIVTPQGRVETLQDPLVASTYKAQCGIAVRGGSMQFTELSLLPLSEIDLSGQ